VERRVGEALAGTVGADEVLQDRHALAEVAAHRDVDDPARRVGHQSAHGAQLADVALVAAGAGVGHHPQRVVVRKAGHHRVRHVLRGALPELDDLLVALVLRDEAALELLVDRGDGVVRPGQQLTLGLGDDDVPQPDGHAAPGGELEADVLDAVDEVGRGDRPQRAVALVHQPLEVRALHRVVAVAKLGGHDPVEQDPADRRADALVHQRGALGVPGEDHDVHRLVEAHRGAHVVGDGAAVAVTVTGLVQLAAEGRAWAPSS
jgi:hypothetical protein